MAGDELREQLRVALSSRFDLQDQIGRGGMAYAFRAHDRSLDRAVVVKVPLLDGEMPIDLARFRRETMLAAQVQHPNVVAVLDAGEVDGVPFYLMPFVDGESLRDRLQRSGRLGVSEAIGFLRDIARGLGAAHAAGIVHRDIKPENILLSGGAAMVIDLGIAKALGARRTDGSTLTGTGVSIGTLGYMAPEQIVGGTIDARTDWYAFGVTAYEMLVGEAPFRELRPEARVAAHLSDPAPSLIAARRDAPMALVNLVEQCLAKDSAARPSDWHAVVAALDAAASQHGDASWLNMLRRRRSALLIASAAAAAIVAAIAIAKRPSHSRADPLTVMPAGTALAPSGRRDSVPGISVGSDHVVWFVRHSLVSGGDAQLLRVGDSLNADFGRRGKNMDKSRAVKPESDSIVAALAARTRAAGARLGILLAMDRERGLVRASATAMDVLAPNSPPCVVSVSRTGQFTSRDEVELTQRVAGLVLGNADPVLQNYLRASGGSGSPGLICLPVRLDALVAYDAATRAQPPKRDTLYRRAIALDSMWDFARFQFARVLGRDGRKSAIDSVIGALPAEATPLERASRLYTVAISARDWQSARTAARELLASDSSFALRAVFVMEEADHPREALTLLDKFSAAHPNMSQIERETVVMRRVWAWWALRNDRAALAGAEWLRDSSTNLQTTGHQYLQYLTAARGDSAQWVAAIDLTDPSRLELRFSAMSTCMGIAEGAGHHALATFIASETIRAARALEGTPSERVSAVRFAVARALRTLGDLDGADAAYAALENEPTPASSFSARSRRLSVAVLRHDEATVSRLESEMRNQLNGPSQGLAAVTLARIAALRKDWTTAATWFQRAVSLGYSRFDSVIRSDSDLMLFQQSPLTRGLLTPGG